MERKLTNDDLYIRQVKLLRIFLGNGAISQAQYAKSYGDLTKKMYPNGVPEEVISNLEKENKNE